MITKQNICTISSCSLEVEFSFVEWKWGWKWGVLFLTNNKNENENGKFKIKEEITLVKQSKVWEDDLQSVFIFGIKKKVGQFCSFMFSVIFWNENACRSCVGGFFLNHPQYRT